MDILNFFLHDNEFPNNGYTHKRQVARAFVINEENEIAILHIKGDDMLVTVIITKPPVEESMQVKLKKKRF